MLFQETRLSNQPGIPLIFCFLSEKASHNQTLARAFFVKLVNCQLDFEDVFCSKIRIKMLKLLFTYNVMHTSEIAEKLKINYNMALQNLEFFEKEGVIKHSMYGRVRYFKFSDSKKAKAINELLNLWTKF